MVEICLASCEMRHAVEKFHEAVPAKRVLRECEACFGEEAARGGLAKMCHRDGKSSKSEMPRLSSSPNSCSVLSRQS